MLVLGCYFKLIGGLMFAHCTSASTLQFWLLALAGTVGIISPTGNEVGPFAALEQSVLADQISPSVRTAAFAYYNLVGYVSSGAGSAEAGKLVDYLQRKVSCQHTTRYAADWTLVAELRARALVGGKTVEQDQVVCSQVWRA